MEIQIMFQSKIISRDSDMKFIMKDDLVSKDRNEDPGVYSEDEEEEVKKV